MTTDINVHNVTKIFQRERILTLDDGRTIKIITFEIYGTGGLSFTCYSDNLDLKIDRW